MLRFLLLILTGAFIGIATNYLALKLIFRPRNPIGIGPFKIQGIIYKRRDKIAENLVEKFDMVLPPFLKLPIINQIVKNGIAHEVNRYPVQVLEEMIYDVAGREINLIIYFWGGLLGAVITALVLLFSGGV
ncbi:MAG: hypothetical protein QW356_03915 [Candidatus Hadarchaeales archaeon]